MKPFLMLGAFGAAVVCWTMVERSAAAEVVRTAFEEVEILLDGTVGIEEIRALPQAPGGAFEEVANAAGAIAQLPTDAVDRLVRRGVSVRTLRRFVLIEGGADDTCTNAGDTASGTRSENYCYGSNSTNVSIPDYGDWAYSAIYLSCAPPGSLVTSIDVHYEIRHEWVEDLDVDLNDMDLNCWVDLWGPYEGWGSDLNETEYDITGCNGLAVNQAWVLWVQDVMPIDEGYIDYWWIKVYYGGGGGEPDLVIESSSRTPATGVNPGGGVDVAHTVANDGDGAAGSAFWATWFISLDSNVTTSDTEWAFHGVTCCLGPGESVFAEGSIPWPDVPPYNTPGQTYYVAVMADDLEEVSESNEDNNWGTTWPVTLAGEGGCCSPPYEAGQRARLVVDNPDDAEGLLAGRCGTVLCCDSDDPALPILISWENWSNGHSSDSWCDEPPGPYPENSAWWMGCAQIVHDPDCACPPPPAPTNLMPPDQAGCVSLDTDLCWEGGGQTTKIIYGNDDRLDVYEVSDPAMLAAVNSIVALVYTSALVDNGNGTYSIPTGYSFTDTIEYSLGDPLCMSERFREQPVRAFCSGVLVGSDLMATAGHCIRNASECANAAFVFGFEMASASTPILTFPASDVYFCDTIVDRVEDSNGADWGVIRLDRPVTGHSPLPIRRTGTVPTGQSLVMVGHPVGLPTKIAGGATVRDNSPPEYFQANVDAYGGNSGSAVMDATSLEIEGLLVRGNTDFALSGDCWVSNWCPDTGCPTWEHVTRTTEFDHLITPMAQVEYDVYFGPCGALELVETTTATCWTPPPLEPGTEYCWRITARNNCGETTAPPDPESWSFTTEPGAIVSMFPPNCAIDARQPHVLNNSSTRFGWDSLDITFEYNPSGLAPSDFTVAQSPHGSPPPPTITSVTPIGGNTLRLQLSGPINPENWTCFVACTGQEVCLGYLPGDVNHGLTTTPDDIVAVIHHLNGDPPRPVYSCDVDRDGECAPADILRVIDLFNGADAFDSWLDMSLPPCPGDTP